MKIKIRPANMRVTHGIHQHRSRPYSVSATIHTEETHVDHYGTAASGSGMDAPETLPTGSIKAFFSPPNMKTCIGFCQRTTEK
jgi:hypothetical protein